MKPYLFSVLIVTFLLSILTACSAEQPKAPADSDLKDLNMEEAEKELDYVE